MRKITSLLIAFLLLLALLPLSVSAEETINDLTKVYNNLNTYLYTPFYEDSEYYDDYQKVLAETKAVLDSDSITQAEITKYYSDLRSAYSALMQDTYDYSSLYVILEGFDQLDSAIFSEESWKKLLSVRDSVQKELEAPALFEKTDDLTEEKYTSHMNRHIKTFSNEFNAAFLALELLDRPETMTSEYLASYTKLVVFCARAELFAETEGWEGFLECVEEAEHSASLNNPREGRLDEDFDDLNEAYAALCTKVFDFAPAKEAITKFYVLSANSFTKASWERYETQVKALEELLTSSHFVYFPHKADKETCQSYLTEYLNSLPTKANYANSTLVPMEDYNKLQELCELNKDKTSMEGLDIKLNLLLTRVKEGEKVLQDSNATKQTIDTAIQNIETASKDLIMAEGHLIDEQAKVVKQDAKTSRFTVIFIVSSILLSAIFAVFLSRMYYGKVNWTK